MQTNPGYAKGLTDGLPKFVSQEGVGGLFKGVTPLWGRQIPYTMMKFGEWWAWGSQCSRGPVVRGAPRRGAGGWAGRQACA